MAEPETPPREDIKILRAKWSFDGAESLEEMAEKLEEKAEHIRSLQDEWELNDTEVRDDYAHLSRKDGDN